MINESKPTTTVTNSAKVSIGETWASIASTWATETRTWLAVSQLFTNSARTTYGDPLWTPQLVWQLPLPWQVNTSVMTNQSKP